MVNNTLESQQLIQDRCLATIVELIEACGAQDLFQLEQEIKRQTIGINDINSKIMLANAINDGLEQQKLVTEVIYCPIYKRIEVYFDSVESIEII